MLDSYVFFYETIHGVIPVSPASVRWILHYTFYTPWINDYKVNFDHPTHVFYENRGTSCENYWFNGGVIRKYRATYYGKDGLPVNFETD